MDLIRWNPFGDLTRIREDIRQLFPESQSFFLPGMPPGRAAGPSVDVRETENEVIVSAEIPGVDPDELDVTVNDNHIILSGEVKRSVEQEKEGYRMMERRYGTFNRTIPLPVEVKPDEAWAEYKNGVLEIRMNKSDQGRARSRKLKIEKQH